MDDALDDEIDLIIEVLSQDTLLYVGGSKTAFRCDCGSNVFRKVISKINLLRYRCNGCGAIYIAEKDDDVEPTASNVPSGV